MRIIAGQFRGRQLQAPPGSATRPTGDRVREALFSMLVSRLGSFEDLRVADLYAGSGALGLEALSRGAAEAVFVETDPKAQAAIKANAAKLGERLIRGVRQLAERHPIIGDVRGKGLMVGMELVKDRSTKEYHPEASRKLVDTAFEQGLLLLGCGKSVVRVAPPLVIDEVDLDRGLALMDEVLATV